MFQRSLINLLCAGTLLLGGTGVHGSGERAPSATLHANPELNLRGPGLTVGLGGAGLSDTLMHDTPPGEVVNPPGIITVEVGGPIERAILYWGGREDSPGDPNLLIDGMNIVGEPVGNEEARAFAFRADLTEYVQGIFAPPGVLMIEIEDPTIQSRLDGGTLVVVYTDPADPVSYHVSVFEGCDFAWGPLPGEGGRTAPISIPYSPAPTDRTAELGIAAGGATRDGADRILVSGNDPIEDELRAFNGRSWDAHVFDVTIPAGSAATAVQLASPTVRGRRSDTIGWVLAALRVPCTGIIGDLVWHDANGNGLQEADEAGIPGVGVTLYRRLETGDLELVDHAVTGPAGEYRFQTICGAEYELEIDITTLPEGYEETNAFASSGGQRDSNFVAGRASVVISADTVGEITIDGGYGDPEIAIPCCFPDGSCVLASAEDCAAAGGTGQGVGGMSCADVDCQVSGACCFPDGTCTVAAPADCIDAGGAPQGDGVECDVTTCRPHAACCFEDGSCVFIDKTDCAAAGGIGGGEGEQCADVECPVNGACCFEDGSCTFVPADDCVAAGGTARGDGVECDAADCPGYGACCFEDGSCTFVPVDDCVAAGGTARGDGVECDTAECPVYGACCFEDGSCTFVPVDDCVAAGGTARGDGAECADVECPVYGACCFEDGSCTFLPAADCSAEGGTAQGDGVACDVATCRPHAACCFEDGSCAFIAKTDCAAAGGIGGGEGEQCADVVCPVYGACCFEDGSCTFLPADDCVAAGGTAQGDGAECDSAGCPVYGACCFEDGSCTFVPAADCSAAGGTAQGDGAECDTAGCPVYGACCFEDGSCTFVPAADCSAEGGTAQGDGAECDTAGCPVYGACCFEDGSCTFVPADDCVAAGGTAQGDGAECDTAGCPVYGACCFEDGSCTFVPADDCVAAGGTAQGDGAECDTAGCPVYGACCFEDGSCTFVPAADCSAAGGMAQGDGAECDSAGCPAYGACCFTDGSCTFVPAADCSAAGGMARGEGVDCGAAACQPFGACCFPDGTCSDMTEGDCTPGGGVYQGGLTNCAPALCPPPPSGGGPTGVGGAVDKGSFVIISKVELRWNEDPPCELIQDTFISLTNDASTQVRVQMYFINGDEPLDAHEGERAHAGWNWVDNAITLTGNQPTWWSAATGQPEGVSPFTVLDPGDPPGRPAMDGTNTRVLRGYILAWAVDANGDEIRWNHLAGNATVLNYLDRFAWEYNSFNHAVVSGVPHGEASDGQPGRLALDGVEYTSAADQLLLNFQAAESEAWGDPDLTWSPYPVVSDTDVTLHPVSADLRQETGGPVTTKAKFTVWNQNEVKFSGAYRCLTCWDQQLLSLYHVPDGGPNHFVRGTLQTDHGKARIDGMQSQLCDVDYDPQDGLAFGDDPRDRVSEDAALIGVAARLLTLDGGAMHAASGANLVTMGREDALVQYDVEGPPAEVHLPVDPTREDLERFINAFLERFDSESLSVTPAGKEVTK